ncbi:decapping and exoribonuclease protein-like [Lytechinus variegatus]|uniref:decapping and exoribonuclease protein-like n=1 Tax=Lytechinus variegatus TaxID=7654 RepID=UPI001BB2A665|nr:decapping and exoribonuclease protein-like [Lytechinus variegatus]XP_041473626.1 decapping and exoribonuclease protein-like [Lytechinus variegatus]
MSDKMWGKNAIEGFSKHVHLGNFSLDENRNYCNDHRNRRFFVDPGPWPKLDLLPGHSEFVDRDRGDGGAEVKSLDALMRWMRDHQDELQRRKILETREDGTKRLALDFVTRRGALHDLFKSPHLNDRTEYLVTFFNGTYYLEQLELPGRRDNPNDPDGTQMYSGKKFAQYCSVQETGEKPEPTQPINDNLSYEAVMAARCGGVFKVLFGVEIHAELQHNPDILSTYRGMHHLNYVNIRTTRDFNALTDLQYSKAFFRKKLFQFWSQNHIAGIPRVILGWRDDDRHVITRVETYKTEDIPDFPLCTWKPVKYYTTMQTLLSEITRLVTDDDAGAVFHLVLEEVENAPYPVLAGKLCSRTFTVKRLPRGSHRIVKDWFIRDVLNFK